VSGSGIDAGAEGRRKLLRAALALVTAGVLVAVVFGRPGPGPGPDPAHGVAAADNDRARAPIAGPVTPRLEAESASRESAAATRLDVTSVAGSERRAQIERVVASMDETGRPPSGVFQGGRRGGERGVFENGDGRLPRRPRGYWIESDVFERRGPRGPERLVFGRGGEVYYTADHYETFARLR
jgi:guanyl-specific ribonuclease Sa